MVGKSAPKPPSSADLPREEIEQRVKKSVARTLARNIPGLALPQTTLDLEVGLTPKDVAYTRDTLRLYHYRPLVAEVYRVPVLIVMSPVARATFSISQKARVLSNTCCCRATMFI